MTDAHIARNMQTSPKRVHETLSKMEREVIIASFMPAGKRVYFLTNRRDPKAARDAGKTGDSDRSDPIRSSKTSRQNVHRGIHKNKRWGPARPQHGRTRDAEHRSTDARDRTISRSGGTNTFSVEPSHNKRAKYGWRDDRLDLETASRAFGMLLRASACLC